MKNEPLFKFVAIAGLASVILAFTGAAQAASAWGKNEGIAAENGPSVIRVVSSPRVQPQAPRP